MDEQLILKNKLKEIRAEKSLSQSELAEMVGVYCVLPWTKNSKRCFISDAAENRKIKLQRG